MKHFCITLLLALVAYNAYTQNPNLHIEAYTTFLQVKANPASPAAVEAAAYMSDAAHKLVPCYEATGNGLRGSWKTLQWELDPYVLLKYRKGIMDRIETLQK